MGGKPCEFKNIDNRDEIDSSGFLIDAILIFTQMFWKINSQAV